MLDTLARIYNDGGRLLRVTCTLFEQNPRFVTAIGLRFESVSAVFRAVPDDDTLEARVGSLAPEPDETYNDASDSAPWNGCLGLQLRSAWRLTNQQGYTDGVRLEFNEPDQACRTVVELVVVASAIRVFVASAADLA